jgi:hypothetical protein
LGEFGGDSDKGGDMGAHCCLELFGGSELIGSQVLPDRRGFGIGAAFGSPAAERGCDPDGAQAVDCCW